MTSFGSMGLRCGDCISYNSTNCSSNTIGECQKHHNMYVVDTGWPCNDFDKNEVKNE